MQKHFEFVLKNVDFLRLEINDFNTFCIIVSFVNNEMRDIFNSHAKESKSLNNDTKTFACIW